MNRSQILLASIALLGSGLCSCSSEEPVINTGEVSDKDQSLYLKVALRDVNSATRAADSDEFFEPGTDAENKIGNLQFKFYDASGKQIFQQTVQDLEFENNTWSVGQIGIATIKVDVEKGENMPAYVVCFANPVDWTGMEDETTMQGLRNVKRNGFKGTQSNFAMNNSVYFGTDPISNSQNVKMVGAPISKGQLFTSEEEANKATEGNIVDIYIERYAAKVKVSVAETAIANSTVGGYTLKFNPEYVGITADAADMYAVKRFSTTDGDDAPIPSLLDVNKDLGTWTSWNDAPLHRSYWACSPAYYATDFPSVADNIIDNAANGATGAGEIVAPYTLKYYSYNQIKNNAVAGEDGAKAIAANGADANLYALENTMGAAAFASRNPKAAAPSVLLVGNTTLSANGTDLPAGTSFFIWNTKIYFDNTVPAGALDGANSIMNAMLATQTVLAADAKGTKLTAAALANSTVEVAHPAKETRDVTGALLSEELVTLQISKVGSNEIFYKPLGSGEWIALPVNDTEALNYVNRQLAGQLNYAHAYTSGKCYYTIPIQHLGYTENTAGAPLTDGKLDWAKVRVGDFGLVRNHVYDINITNINGYGTGILDLDNPIVTPMETNSYWIKYSLNVLNWRIVPTQNVVLP